MSVIDRGLDSLTFLTDRGREALRRRLRELAGAALIIIAMLIAVAMKILFRIGATRRTGGFPRRAGG